MRKSCLALLCLAFVLSLTAGCKVKPPAKVTIPVPGKGSVTVNTGSNVDLSALPAQLHYPGATATGSWSATTPKGQGTAYTFETTDDLSKVTEFFKAAMPAWKTQSTTQTQEGTMLAAASPDEKEGMVTMISASEGKTTVVVTYWKNTGQ
jgi:hypothetical protein